MTDIMNMLFIDVDLSQAKQTLFCDCNCDLIASKVSAYSLGEILLRLIVDSSTRSPRNVFYNCRSSRCNMAFHGMWAETIPTMKLRFYVSWWKLEVPKSYAARLENCVYHFSQLGLTWMWNRDVFCEHTLVISWVPCHFTRGKDDSVTIE
jgi:hypothetical protein